VVTSAYHEPVLLAETLGLLDLNPGSVIIDGTLGGAG
jgi:16S rRNA C1402 N4-methylase RsmH